MPSINMAKIASKADIILHTPKIKKKIMEAADKKILGGFTFFSNSNGTGNIYHIADAFIKVLRAEIDNSIGTNFAGGSISATAAAEFMRLGYDPPKKIRDGVYSISVYFVDNGHRDSVAPKLYDGVDNIIDLLNAGYHTKSGKSIRGDWRGAQILTLPSRHGAHFIDDAIRVFMRDCAREFHVISIEPNGEYRL